MISTRQLAPLAASSISGKGVPPPIELHPLVELYPLVEPVETTTSDFDSAARSAHGQLNQRKRPTRRPSYTRWSSLSRPPQVISTRQLAPLAAGSISGKGPRSLAAGSISGKRPHHAENSSAAPMPTMITATMPSRIFHARGLANSGASLLPPRPINVNHSTLAAHAPIANAHFAFP
ncbi:Uncharacterised protein [Mycobacteroides abscessus subsp. abscessus]|nr:Uncharacterised protein [Mycobacteroides abscessus subsp. abscessus]